MFKTAVDAFNRKIVVCGDIIEFFEYQYPITFNNKVDLSERKKVERLGDEKRLDNLYRARLKVRQIIWCNLTPHSKFLTLTCENTVLDYKQFQRMLQTFFQQMTRNGFKLKYLYVIERQKERGIKECNVGSLHAHIIVFNDEKIPLDILNKAWHYGTTDIHMIDGLKTENQERVNDIGAYVCKYITKESELEFGSKCYKCSIGLNRPIDLKIHGYRMDDDFYCPDDRMKNYNDLKESVNIKYSRDGFYEIPCSDGGLIKNTYKVFTGVIKK